ncbi:hypothetical protein DAPPUDRAFT_316109 [Daphnia pulex]|uniref:C-type lectin domain-containing protein n=1 Tax=Daphnia pulex TaxID=6669 RepID=E9GBQ8_DAPPU|nr:hypothetical protein DAPPUDRAFT_316109 [Daphnia pulex]|eukprot:EFX83115.1 hypothetical protein DAPPUDRAFT_316109 [Daphnia pulex]
MQFLLVLVTVAVSLSKQDEQEKVFILSLEIDPQSARILLNNDFESGSADPWYDSSPSTVHWDVEDFTMPSEVNYPPAIPLSGTKYLRATRDAQLSPGFVILRTVEFMALPGDRITFKFWIRSKYTFGNTLELILAIGDTETTLLTLSSYSTSVNVEWRQASTLIPVPEPTVLTLAFYESCGGNAEDAIAIDDIVLEPSDEITTTGLTTVTSTTTVKPMLKVETEEEEKLIYNHWQVHPELKSEKYWTSGKFPQKGYNRTYEWATIEPFQRFTYTNWQSGKPGHSDFGYCVYFFMDFDFESGYYWVDYLCNSFYLEYICESV